MGGSCAKNGSRTPYCGYKKVPEQAPETQNESEESYPPGVSQQAFDTQVAAGKAMGILMHHAKGTCSIDHRSVYGAALALPQLARTAGWSLGYTSLAIRCFMLLIVNLLLQGFLLYMIAKEERIMSKFGGQMRLCDFAAHIGKCPSNSNCVGPGGTLYTPERLYDWNMWSTRVYVRDSFKALFPEKTDDIDQLVDPGEYGVESYYLRMVSVLIFIIGLWSDFASSYEIFMLIYSVPTEEEPWMSYDVRTSEEKERADHLKTTHNWSELDLVTFKIAGMPLFWKIVNLCFVLLPKVFIWILTIDIGVIFLMETSVIEDMIINAVALSFILDMDELICGSLMTNTSKYMLEHIEPLTLYDTTEEESATPWEVYDAHERDKQWNLLSPGLYTRIFPGRLFSIIAVTLFFVSKYYIENCIHLKDGSWVAKDLHLPQSESFPLQSFLFGPLPGWFPVRTEDATVWSMPEHPADMDEFYTDN